MKNPNDRNEQEKRALNRYPHFSRRQFLTSAGLATAGLLAGACGKDSPTEPKKTTPKVYPEGSSKVATAKLTSYDLSTLKSSIQTMLEQIGGVGDILKSGDTVGIKINLTGGAGSASSYERSSGLPVGETYWTNPVVLQAVCELMKDAGAGTIYVLEAIYDQASLDSFGYSDVINHVGATFVDLNGKAPYSGYASRPVGNYKLIYPNLTQNGVLNDLDCFISLPKAKVHIGAGVTHGMKNLVGTLPMPAGIYNNVGDSNRSKIHNHRDKFEGNPDSNLCRVILDLNHATPINLVINDAVKTVLGSEGPWNRQINPKSFNRLVAGKDPVAVDSISTKIIGYDPMAADMTKPFTTCINYLKKASELGMGNYDLDMIEVVGAGI